MYKTIIKPETLEALKKDNELQLQLALKNKVSQRTIENWINKTPVYLTILSNLIFIAQHLNTTVEAITETVPDDKAQKGVNA
jgi:hypothetical protein